MPSRKNKSFPAMRRDAFELKAWPPSVVAEGWGLPVAVLGLIVLLAIMTFGAVQVANANLNVTVHVVQEPVQNPEKPPDK